MLPLDLDILPWSKSSQPLAFTERGSGNARRHQKRRPVDAVEAADLLADQVQVGRPELFEPLPIFGRIGTIAQRRNVVGQRVQPHVDHVLLVAGHGNAPRKTRPAHRQVLQPPAHKRDDLAPRGLRPHEPWIRLVELQQLALEGRELEEIILLAHRLGDAPAVRAGRAGWAVHIQLIATRSTGRYRSLCR